MAKSEVLAKIGTHNSKIVVLWNSEPAKVGDWIYAMDKSIYMNLHSSFRRLKKCQYWQQYRVDRIDEILFLSKI